MPTCGYCGLTLTEDHPIYGSFRLCMGCFDVLNRMGLDPAEGRTMPRGSDKGKGKGGKGC